MVHGCTNLHLNSVLYYNVELILVLSKEWHSRMHSFFQCLDVMITQNFCAINYINYISLKMIVPGGLFSRVHCGFAFMSQCQVWHIYLNLCHYYTNTCVLMGLHRPYCSAKWELSYRIISKVNLLAFIFRIV